MKRFNGCVVGFPPGVMLAIIINATVLVTMLWQGCLVPSAAQTSPNFARFRNNNTGWDILNDPEIVKLIHVMMGNKDQDFWDCSQASAMQKSGDELLINSSVEGLYNDRISFLDLNLSTNKYFAGYLIDGTYHVFGASEMKQLPRLSREYLEALTVPSMQISFEKPDWTPLPIKKSAPTRKLNLSSVTGTYERAASRFTNAELKVEALPFDKIRFEISALSGGRTGEASGLLEMVNHQIVLPHDEGKLVLEFKGDIVTISGQDSPFCGAGVTLLGDYKKADDKKPKFSPDE